MINTVLLLAAALPGPSLKIKVDGDGYLRLLRDGRAVYAKQATVHVQDGKLTDSAGDPFLPSIAIGDGVTDIRIDLQGNVTAGYGAAMSPAGQLVLADFSATAGLVPEDVVLTSDEKPTLGNPGDDKFGVVRIVPKEGQPAVVIPTTLSNRIQTQAATLRPRNAIAGASAARGAQITVQEHSVEGADKILLGDVAQIDGSPEVVAALSKVELGDTPPVGVKRTIDRIRILNRIRAAGLAPEDYTISIPDDADVRRRGQTVPNSQFVTTAIQALMTHGALTGTWQSTDNFSDLEVPSGKLELKAESMNGQETENAAVIVAIYIDGNRFNSRTVHLHLQETAPPIRAGNVVKVILIAGSAQVEVSGIARTSGHMGQNVDVEVQLGNPPVRTYHTGVVAGPDLVQVKL